MAPKRAKKKLTPEATEAAVAMNVMRWAGTTRKQRSEFMAAISAERMKKIPAKRRSEIASIAAKAMHAKRRAKE